jgi:hypothetical protein
MELRKQGGVERGSFRLATGFSPLPPEWGVARRTVERRNGSVKSCRYELGVSGWYEPSQTGTATADIDCVVEKTRVGEGVGGRGGDNQLISAPLWTFSR